MKYPKNPNGTIDKTKVELMYKSSELIEWGPFAKSKGWNPDRSRSDFPVADWVCEKKKIYAQLHAEVLADLLMRHNYDWHKEVLATIQANKKTSTTVEETFNFWTDSIKNRMEEDPESVSPREIERLVKTGNVLIDLRFRAAMVDKWSWEQAESFSKAPKKEEERSEGFTIEIIGHEKGVTLAQLQQWGREYYDPPQLPAEEPDAPHVGPDEEKASCAN